MSMYTFSLLFLASAVDLGPVVIWIGIRSSVYWAIILGRKRRNDRTLDNGQVRKFFFELARSILEV